MFELIIGSHRITNVLLTAELARLDYFFKAIFVTYIHVHIFFIIVHHDIANKMSIVLLDLTFR